ncbi:hypothetical protein [Micromonospora aurantiaca (nom. illeg.)]|uniref:hypothetical protein n=1 Tax=Micromonospora aurantiaca (nom. illeg.) TaxID=47850 RepID=UPI001863AC13
MKTSPAQSSTAVTVTASDARKVTFRVPITARVVHEDNDTEIAAFEYLLDEALDGGAIRVAGCHNHTLTPPGPADPHTQRRLRAVAADARVTVTAPAGTAPTDVTRRAARQLTSRLRVLRHYGIRLLDAPTVWQDSEASRDEQDPLDTVEGALDVIAPAI